MLSASSALAAKDTESTPLKLDDGGTSQAASSGGSGGSIVRTVVGLAIVIGVIYGVYWILKQVKASREESASGQGLSSVATLPLGPNRSLHLVKSGQELVLLGVGEQGVTPIRTYSEADAREAGLIADDTVTIDAEEDEIFEPVPVAALEAATMPAQARRALPAPVAKSLNGNGNGKAVNGNGKPATVGEFMNRFVADLRMRTVRK